MFIVCAYSYIKQKYVFFKINVVNTVVNIAFMLSILVYSQNASEINIIPVLGHWNWETE